MWEGADGSFIGPEVSTARRVLNWGILKFRLQGQYPSAPCEERNGKCQIALDLPALQWGCGSTIQVPPIQGHTRQPPESLLVTDGLSESSFLPPSRNRLRCSGGSCQSADQLCIQVWRVFYLCGLQSAPLSFPEVLWPFSLIFNIFWALVGFYFLNSRLALTYPASSPFAYPPPPFLKSSLCFIRPSTGGARCCSLQLGIVFCSPPGPGTEGPQEDSHRRAFFLPSSWQALSSYTHPVTCPPGTDLAASLLLCHTLCLACCPSLPSLPSLHFVCSLPPSRLIQEAP